MSAPADPDLTLVVPVYNEHERLRDFVEELIGYSGARPGGCELLFVDDGSSDGTADTLEAMIRDRATPLACVLRRPHEGKGAAVTAGIRAGHGRVVAFCDLDLSTPLSQLDLVIEAASRADVLAIGSRDLYGSVLVHPQGKVREALGRAYNRLLQATVVPGVVDTQCGAKAAPAAVWRMLLSLCHQKGFAWDAELCAVALATGVELQEVAITWSHDDRSKVHVLADGWAMVRETPHIWRSARSARAESAVAADERSALLAGPQGGVFDEANAERMQAVDRTHWWFRSKAAFVSTALRRTSTSRDGWLVDAGGGSGGVSAMLGWPTARVAVVEGNPTLVSTARSQLGLTALQGAVDELPVADGSVQVVCLLDVIEHLVDPRAALLEARRVIGPAGRLVINVPAHSWLWSQADVELGHQRRYTRSRLRNELLEAGLEPMVMTHVFSWLVPPVWLLRRVARPGTAELGLDRRSAPIDVASLVLTALERQVIGRLSLPFGTSVLCVAKATSRPAEAN